MLLLALAAIITWASLEELSSFRAPDMGRETTISLQCPNGNMCGVKEACEDAHEHQDKYFPGAVGPTNCDNDWSWIKRWILRNGQCTSKGIKEWNIDARKKSIEAAFVLDRYLLAQDAIVAYTTVKPYGMFLQLLNLVLLDMTTTPNTPRAFSGTAYANLSVIPRFPLERAEPAVERLAELMKYYADSRTYHMHEGKLISASLSLQDCSRAESAMSFLLSDTPSMLTGMGGKDSETVEAAATRAWSVIEVSMAIGKLKANGKLKKCQLQFGRFLEEDCRVGMAPIARAYTDYLQELERLARPRFRGKKMAEWPLRELQLIVINSADLARSAYVSRRFGVPSFPLEALNISTHVPRVSREEEKKVQDRVNKIMKTVIDNMGSSDYESRLLERVKDAKRLDQCPTYFSCISFRKSPHSRNQMRVVPPTITNSAIQFVRISDNDDAEMLRLSEKTYAVLRNVVETIVKNGPYDCEEGAICPITGT